MGNPKLLISIIFTGSIGESGCRKSHHCRGGALCLDGRCQCPSGYVPTAGNTKCANASGKLTYPKKSLSSRHWQHHRDDSRLDSLHCIKQVPPGREKACDRLAVSSYYNSSSVCVCVPYLLRGPLTDLRQTWWVYVG